MHPIRSMVAGLAGASLVVLLTAAPALAADDSSYTGPAPAPVTTVAPAPTQPSVVVEAAQVSSTPAATTSAPVSGSLPFTGGDVAGLTLAGLGLTAVGTGLVVRSRRRRQIA